VGLLVTYVGEFSGCGDKSFVQVSEPPNIGMQRTRFARR